MRFQSIDESEIEFGGKKIAFTSAADWFGRDISSAVTAANGTGNLGSVGYFLTYKETSSTATEYIDTYTSTVTPVSGTKTDTIYRYTYDNNGNIRTITKDGILQYTYNYDEAGQLTRTDDTVQNKTVTYTYNIGGNIVSKKEYAYTTGALGAAVNTVTYTYDSVWKDKLASYDGNVINYDAIGNPLSYDGNTFEWNGRILNGISNGTKSLSFKYNENSLRTEKKVTQGGSTTTYSYIWNGDKLVSQSDGTNTLYFFYNDSEYAPDGFVLNGTDTYLYTKNLQGDVTGIADENGITVTAYTYDAWGKITSVTGTAASTIGSTNPFRYRGYYYDTETGLYYLQSRYYNPEWGRFLNADDFEKLGTLPIIYDFKYNIKNIYAYGNNNPILFYDSNGHVSQLNDFSKAMQANLIFIGFISVFFAFNNKIRIGSDKQTYDAKKGYIKIDIYADKNDKFVFSDILFDLYKEYGYITFVLLATYASGKFYDEFPTAHNKEYSKDTTVSRSFLFSIMCVADEIYKHCIAYWWTEGKVKMDASTYLMWKHEDENVNELKKRCKTIDIFEQDATDIEDRTMFGYYNGIESIYQKTLADPFYQPILRIRNPLNVRNDWKTKKIPIIQ